MKKLFLIFISIWFTGCANTRSLLPSDMQVQKVIDAPGVSQKVLFDRSKAWYASKFGADYVAVQYESRENGTIMANAIVYGDINNVALDLKFTLLSEVKDNKARITANGQTVIVNNRGVMGVQKDVWDQFENRINRMLDNYLEYVKRPSTDNGKDNW